MQTPSTLLTLTLTNAQKRPLRRPANTSPPTSDPGADNGRSGLDRLCQEGPALPSFTASPKRPPQHLQASASVSPGRRRLQNLGQLEGPGRNATMAPGTPRGWNTQEPQEPTAAPNRWLATRAMPRRA